MTTRVEWLRAYDALGPVRKHAEHLYREAERTGNYGQADEFGANLNEALADLADQAADILREEREEAEERV